MHPYVRVGAGHIYVLPLIYHVLPRLSSYHARVNKPLISLTLHHMFLAKTIYHRLISPGVPVRSARPRPLRQLLFLPRRVQAVYMDVPERAATIARSDAVEEL